jgi:uncharacterized protein YdeI (YjbR/CyaY-like superfamily)
MTKTDPKVDEYIKRIKQWQEEVKTLRAVILDFPLTEELKWGLPCYSLEKGNVVIIQVFKDYCAVMFFKGALLKDAKGVLSTPGKTQAGRQIRFTSAREIVEMEAVVKSYIHEAFEVEKAGLKVKYKKATDFPIPEEFQKKLDELPALKAAFAALTPGRQKAYIFYVSAAKRSQTRESRVEQCMQQILSGKGLDDQ